MADLRPEWVDKHYAFFSNHACEYFPCHDSVAEEDFNCVFCYCPLYALGEACGGNCVLLENGVKDCSLCTLPHRRENYEVITEKCSRLLEELHRKQP